MSAAVLPPHTKLHGASFSRAWRTHWIMRELGLLGEIVQVHIDIHPNKGLFPGNAKALADYRALSPDARVPALELGGDPSKAIFESGAIALFLAKAVGAQRSPLAPRDAVEEAQMSSWVIWAHGYVETPAIDLMFGTMRRNPEKRKAVMAACAAKLERPMAALDSWLRRKGQGGKAPHLVGERFTVADLQVSAVLQPAMQVPSWRASLETQHPGVTSWLDLCFSRPKFKGPSAFGSRKPARL